MPLTYASSESGLDIESNSGKNGGSDKTGVLEQMEPYNIEKEKYRAERIEAVLEDNNEYPVEKVLDRSWYQGVLHHQIKWLTYSPSKNCWVRECDMIQCEEAIQEFEKLRGKDKLTQCNFSSKIEAGDDKTPTRHCTSKRLPNRRRFSNKLRLEEK